MRPRFFTYPNRIRIGSFCIGRLNTKTHADAVLSAASKSGFRPDIIYSHFLFLSGSSAVIAAKKLNVPLVVALGESTMSKHEKIYGIHEMKRVISQCSAILSVSATNRDYCIEELGYPEDKIKVLPNAVDTTKFYPRDKAEMRHKFNFPQNQLLIAFTGHFNLRKGPLRLLDAINRVNPRVNAKGIFIGNGNQTPVGSNVLFASSVAPSMVPELLSAADIFALPTLNEGSCNAILEAQACGLPIISANIRSIKEQVSADSAILVDPLSAPELANAIVRLAENTERRQSMAKASLDAVKNNTTSARSDTIFDWLNQVRADSPSLW